MDIHEFSLCTIKHGFDHVSLPQRTNMQQQLSFSAGEGDVLCFCGFDDVSLPQNSCYGNRFDFLLLSKIELIDRSIFDIF